jgi:HSP20 family protein
MTLDPNSVYFTGFDDHFFAVPWPHEPRTGISPVLTKFKEDTLSQSSPSYHVTHNEKGFRLDVDVPGMKPEDVTIELKGRVLHLSGSRGVNTAGEHRGHAGYHFDKSFKLARGLDTSKITAHLSDGVLMLTFPKMDKVAPTTRRIEITQGEAPVLMDEGDEK